MSKVKQAVVPTFISGSLFWPAANLINFMTVPPAGRVLYANAAGLLWNTFLSYENSTKGVVATAAGSASKTS